MPRSRALGCAIWRVWAAAALRMPAEPASTSRPLHDAAPPPIRPRIGDVTLPRPRAGSSGPETDDLVASTIERITLPGRGSDQAALPFPIRKTSLNDFRTLWTILVSADIY